MSRWKKNQSAPEPAQNDDAAQRELAELRERLARLEETTASPSGDPRQQRAAEDAKWRTLRTRETSDKPCPACGTSEHDDGFRKMESPLGIDGTPLPLFNNAWLCATCADVVDPNWGTRTRRTRPTEVMTEQLLCAALGIEYFQGITPLARRYGLSPWRHARDSEATGEAWAHNDLAAWRQLAGKAERRMLAGAGWDWVKVPDEYYVEETVERFVPDALEPNRAQFLAKRGIPLPQPGHTVKETRRRYAGYLSEPLSAERMAECLRADELEVERIIAERSALRAEQEREAEKEARRKHRQAEIDAEYRRHLDAFDAHVEREREKIRQTRELALFEADMRG